jgi:hypothetical protein
VNRFKKFRLRRKARKSAAGFLTVARDHLNEVGLNKNGSAYGSFRPNSIDEAPVCVLGAMWWVRDHLLEIPEAPQDAYCRLEGTYQQLRTSRDLPSSMTHWNDHYATKEDVLALFDAAISLK